MMMSALTRENIIYDTTKEGGEKEEKKGAKKP